VRQGRRRPPRLTKVACTHYEVLLQS
jgi:hypothetical protein